MSIHAGQVWRMKATKTRYGRYVRVQFVCMGGRRVRIKRCNKRGLYPNGAKSTEVAAERFGKPGGFLLTDII